MEPRRRTGRRVVRRRSRAPRCAWSVATRISAHDIKRLRRLAGEREQLAPTPQRLRIVWKGDMGITIVQKSDLTVRKRNPRIALVLAGGAVSGGGFKLGGLKAFDDFLVNRKTTDFDIYVGLSAGAFLAAPLASGVTPPEMLRSLEGSSEEFTQFGAFDFYQPNYPEFVERPIRYLLDLAAFIPGSILDLVAKSPALAEASPSRSVSSCASPSLGNAAEVLRPLGQALLVGASVPLPARLSFRPGFFDNVDHRALSRATTSSAGTCRTASRRCSRPARSELYIVAMNLDSAERVVFGHDEDSSLTISEAVQASTALPGFYKPARIQRHRLRRRRRPPHRQHRRRDRSRRRSGHLLQPVPPVLESRRPQIRPAKDDYVAEGVQLADRGMLTILNQVLRTLLHSRLAARPPPVSGRPELQAATSS